jgi:hypothetical protein
MKEIFKLFPKFIPRYLKMFEAIVNGIFFSSDCSLCIKMLLIFAYWFCILIFDYEICFL